MNYQSSLKKIIKYFIVFGVIYLLTIFVPSNKMSVYESLIISMGAAILYAALDIFYPSYIIEDKQINYNA